MAIRCVDSDPHKEKVLSSLFQIYMVLFNEVNLTNLLETILFSSSACEALGDSAIDLTDYCVRHLTCIMSTFADQEIQDNKKRTITR